jgi:hypothetical protein
MLIFVLIAERMLTVLVPLHARAINVFNAYQIRIVVMLLRLTVSNNINRILVLNALITHIARIFPTSRIAQQVLVHV